MKVKLNFTLGQKTVNGRYYDPDMLKQQFDNLIQKNGFISVGPDSSQINEADGSIPLEILVGTVKQYEISESGEIFFDVQEMSTQTENYIKANPEKVKLSIFGFGNMDENKIVRDFTLTCLFMTLE